MATRKGATKTVGGKRYRYNGSKWIQVKATGNVTPTSSRNRSTRSRSSSANVTNDNNRPRRGGTRTTTDTQRTSTGSAKVTTKPKALPPGTKGGALATTKPPRRRNVNSNAPSSGTRTARGGLPPQLRGVLETRGILPPATTPAGTSKPTDGRRAPTRRQTAADKARQAAQGSSSSGVRTGGTRNPGVRRMGPLSGLVEQGLSRLLDPVARTVGYEGAKAIRGALGGGAPKLDKNGNPIKKPVAKGTGLKDVNGKPLPAARGAFNAVISSKVPQGSTTPTKPTPPKDTPKPTPTGSTGSSGGGSGRSTVKPKPVPKTGANDPRNAAYIAARSKLNSKSTKAERDKVRDMGMAIHNKAFGKKAKPAAKSTKAKPATSADAQNLRAGRSPDPTPKKKKKRKVLPYFGGNGIGSY